MPRVVDNKEGQYTCGKCGRHVYYSIYDSAPDCPECGWEYKEESQYNVPKPKVSIR